MNRRIQKNQGTVNQPGDIAKKKRTEVGLNNDNAFYCKGGTEHELHQTKARERADTFLSLSCMTSQYLTG